MIATEPIGWWNTGAPLVLLCALALALPRLLVARATRSHRDVAVAVAVTAGLVLVAGEAVFALIYGLRGVGVWEAFMQAPLVTGGFFLRLSAFAALVWGPLLALIWLGLAQGVEKRKGEDLVKYTGEKTK